MSITAAELARRLGAELRGDGAVCLDHVAPLREAGPGGLSFLANSRYRAQLAGTGAAAVLLREQDAEACPVTAIVCADPYLAYARAAQQLYPPRPAEPGVHPSAWVDPSAQLGEGVSVGPQACVEAGAVLGEGVLIGPGCMVGRNVRIGAHSRLVASVSVGDDCRLGERVLLHPGVVIGADGFGFANDAGRWEKIPQVGAVELGDDVEIGANTCVDRGALSNTVLEEGVKLDNLIQIGHNVRIGAHTAVAAHTAIAGSADIGRHCMIAGCVGIAGHLSICDEVQITAMSMVIHSISEPGVYSSGTQVTPNAQWRRNAVRFNQLDDMARRLRALEKRAAAGPDSNSRTEHGTGKHNNN
ncbi:UDP-3-O-(3-hydroxymyristoyl)glucosamine N-acyltransferase [Alkalilimnicola sp. S0819]|uniref:UDP-3-O-(3-hydroxymyristoyl)glucosamine N-acyltransferase n=1 Tax=Alkalilimnicola sp. S0819 TaxID=2613922 RepID=UPI001261ACC4|nr:UDP-3-O-(3-hydroxymyristoyl)glucosamine N-acyltransferase [Alkalilimnicola sp. S0819]KAB7627925.1 UDP-3-O-(3-hydroxymyristoyl)glucosamine N-acyltransferase [Alkalilimnicola sp. S0819]MPQ15562.1 UDP-3-O-(3-hydroxymyristoyl)glucosamine N-acyltransferase [Alkalilimnicola sp. S0819]